MKEPCDHPTGTDTICDTCGTDVATPVSVPIFSVPGDRGGTPVAVGTIADTPENRAWLETLAIPKCRQWREANPEHVSCFGPDVDAHSTCEYAPAPYCCSAYCPRCAGLRALNGDDPALTPNEWMTQR